MNIREQILESLKSHAVGKINKHKMNIEIYLSNPVGIGNTVTGGLYPNVMDAITEELKIVAEYDNQISMIEKYLK